MKSTQKVTQGSQPLREAKKMPSRFVSRLRACLDLPSKRLIASKKLVRALLELGGEQVCHDDDLLALPPAL